jgi:hypothetical protein
MTIQKDSNGVEARLRHLESGLKQIWIKIDEISRDGCTVGKMYREDIKEVKVGIKEMKTEYRTINEKNTQEITKLKIKQAVNSFIIGAVYTLIFSCVVYVITRTISQ